jgi:hypothetical protein
VAVLQMMEYSMVMSNLTRHRQFWRDQIRTNMDPQGTVYKAIAEIDAIAKEFREKNSEPVLQYLRDSIELAESTTNFPDYGSGAAEWGLRGKQVSFLRSELGVMKALLKILEPDAS